MVLNGYFIITSQATGSPVGCNYSDQRDPNPKRVVVLPEGVEDPKWELEGSPDGNGAFMKINGNYIGVIDELVYAIVEGGPQPAMWRIEPAFFQGKDSYLISLADRPREGWTIPPDVGEQIAIRSLVVQPTDPPRCLPSQLFMVTRAN